jgi:hypothetical protein
MAFASAIIVLGLSAMMFCFDQSTAMNKLSEIKQQCQQEYSNLIDRQNCTSEPSFQIMGELDVAAATGLVLLFSSTIIAMQFYIILGIQFRTLKPELVKEEHQIPEAVKAKINRSFPLQIAIGVCLVLIGIVEMIVVYGLGLAPRDSTFPVGVMFILMALAVFLFVYGGIQKSSINRDSKQLTAGQVKKRQLVDRLTGVIMLVATGVYLGFGFFIDSWGWLWPVFPIAAILCAILSVAMSPEED